MPHTLQTLIGNLWPETRTPRCCNQLRRARRISSPKLLQPQKWHWGLNICILRISWQGSFKSPKWLSRRNPILNTGCFSKFSPRDYLRNHASVWNSEGALCSSIFFFGFLGHIFSPKFQRICPGEFFSHFKKVNF